MKIDLDFIHRLPHSERPFQRAQRARRVRTYGPSASTRTVALAGADDPLPDLAVIDLAVQEK